MMNRLEFTLFLKKVVPCKKSHYPTFQTYRRFSISSHCHMRSRCILRYVWICAVAMGKGTDLVMSKTGPFILNSDDQPLLIPVSIGQRTEINGCSHLWVEKYSTHRSITKSQAWSTPSNSVVNEGMEPSLISQVYLSCIVPISLPLLSFIIFFLELKFRLLGLIIARVLNLETIVWPSRRIL